MKKYFVTGVIFLLPLALTIMIVAFVVNFLTAPFLGVMVTFLKSLSIEGKGFLFLSEAQVLRYSCQVLILLLLTSLTIFFGFLTQWYLMNYIIRISDYVLHRIPIVNKLYKTSQDIIHTLFGSQNQSFKQVVMVPFPTPDIFCVGLVTQNSPPICRKSANADLVSVFVPTTPNPTSGYLLMFKRKDIHYLEMSVEDAIKFIISCGVIFPDDPLSTEGKPAKVSGDGTIIIKKNEDSHDKPK